MSTSVSPDAPVAATDAVSELWMLGASELAGLIRSRRASSREVVEAHLRRIDAVNPAVNAVPIVMADSALAAADSADRAVVAGDELGPLHGVPFTVKANIDVAGTPTTLGLKAMAAAYPSRDAPVVERMRMAGAIPIGRTNCSTITVRWHTVSELWGATLNPWDASRTPGASSGGEAAALATGMSPLGLGNDGLGSLRWPAQCCGIAALKPTLGRVPQAATLEPVDGSIGLQLTAVTGPMARRVADLRLALEVMAGPTWRDPWSIPAPLAGPRASTPIRVAVVVDPAGRGTSRQVADGVRLAASALEDAGYDIEEIEPPSVELAAACLLQMLATPDVRALQQSVWPMLPADTRTFLAAFYEVVGEIDAAATVQSFVARAALLRAWGEFQQTYPLIVAPVSTRMPFAADADLAAGQVAATVEAMRMTLAINALGLPAVAVPVGVADGLPQEVQVIGPRFREDLCLDAAEAIEARCGVLTPIDPR